MVVEPTTNIERLELQEKLDAIAEDLKKTRAQLAFVEQEKVQAIEELNEAKRLTNETNEKLAAAIVSKKMIEDRLEVEKVRADELEQESIEGARKKEEHQKELESVRNQHALDGSALLSMTREFQKVKLESTNANIAKNTALSKADC